MEENRNNIEPNGKFEFPVLQDNPGCCGGGMAPKKEPCSPPCLDQDFVSGSIATPQGNIPRVSSTLSRQDRWGTIRTRLGAGRMKYAVDPGLYALGKPDEQSPVLVTANYKMSFDYLRQSLPNQNAWILVLDTMGINVWCAAGKGTFGTQELIWRIETSRLKNIVRHRNLILPQLGAPGVSAHLVRQASGFRVHYGPVRAKDLPAYLDSGFKAKREMRIMAFPLKDRAVLIPIELLAAVRPYFIAALVLMLLSGILGPSGFLKNILHDGMFVAGALLLAIAAGTILLPLLLPYLPGRAFSVKGLFIGLVVAVGLIYMRGMNFQIWAERIQALAWVLIIPAVSAYLGMNFTGCSTYTSLSGVKKEMQFALPMEITAGILGIAAWMTSVFLA
jgi:acetyl-CoA decarbonylase/synthase complex subunit gamma